MNLKMSKMFPNHFENERGRSLIELMGMLAVMGLLTVGAIKIYHRTVNNTKVQNTANMIQTLALERQNSAISLSQGGRMLREGPHSDIYIENGTSGKFKNYFWIDTTLTDEDFCEGLKESELIKADVVEGTCPGTVTFYFKKNPYNSSVSGTYTDATGRHFCSEHTLSCTDADTPESCEDGYELLWGDCIVPPPTCTDDTDCSACGHCDTDVGYCKDECEVPTNSCETNSQCNTGNQCMFCNTTTQSCENGCSRVSYVENVDTNSWFIIPIKMDASVRFKADLQIVSYFVNGQYKMLFGSRKSSNSSYESYVGFDTSSDHFLVTGKYVKEGLGHSVCRGDTVTATQRHVLEFTGTAFNVDGTTCTNLGGGTKNYNNYYTGVFGLASSNTAMESGSLRVRFKLYSLWMKDDTNEVNLVPVHVSFNSANRQNCMFDNVNGVLYCNQGSGADFSVP